jgi:hypothetical protein
LRSKASRRALERASLKALKREGVEALGDSRAGLEAIALYVEQLAYRPFFDLAVGIHSRATAVAEEVGQATSALCAGATVDMGGKATAGSPLRVGDPVNVTLQLGERAATPCPTVTLGPYALTTLKGRHKGSCSYALTRLGVLPSGPATLHVRAQP